MTTFEAVMLAEETVPTDCGDDAAEAWQYLIDTGLAWTLQGWFGRTAAALIQSGICLPTA